MIDLWAPKTAAVYQAVTVEFPAPMTGLDALVGEGNWEVRNDAVPHIWISLPWGGVPAYDGDVVVKNHVGTISVTTQHALRAFGMEKKFSEET